MDIRSLARALGGNVAGRGSVTCPGPGHGCNDRSLSVTFDDTAPDGFLVNSFAGDDFAACRDHVRYLLGLGAFEPRRQADQPRHPFAATHQPDTGRRVEFAASLWQEAKSLGCTPVETYLHGRGIDLPGDLYTGEVLRFHPACPFRLDSGETIRLPAMLSAMVNAETNLFQGVHRTALQSDGSGKAKVAGLPSAKKMLGPSGGAVVKLTPDEDVTIRLNIAEGIEDALTVLGNFGIAPIWATMTSGTMKSFPVLPGIETLAIFANNDLPKLHSGRFHQAGNEAAQACAARWVADGRDASIWLPPRIGSDFNNLVEREGCLMDAYLSPEDRLLAAGATVVPLDGIAASEKPGRKPRFIRTNTTALMAKHFEPIRWIVEGYLPEGFLGPCGRQKLGKTWLAIDIALAVSCGGAAMGSIDCEQGGVLYIDMENGERRIQRRIDALYPDGRNRPNLSRLEWATDAPPLDKGLIDALDDWRRSVINPRLVVIDVLQRIKPAGVANRNAYENDYSIWSPLQSWATQHGIAVLGLHHTKKGGADDPLEALSGSNGLSACADTTLVLDRDGNGITLYVRGRDVDEKETAMTFMAGIWSIQGEAAKVRMTSERQSILDALQDADEPMSPSEIAIAASMKRNNVDRLLGKMAKATEIRKVARGRYIHPGRADLTDNGAP